MTCPPMSCHLTLTEGFRLVRVRCRLHDDTHAAQGRYPNAERVLELPKTISSKLNDPRRPVRRQSRENKSVTNCVNRLVARAIY